MEKRFSKGLLVLFIVVSTVVGAGLGQAYNRFSNKSHLQKPVVGVTEPDITITAQTPVVFEQEFLKCGHKVVSSFPGREKLNGKTITEIQLIYTSAQSYQVSWNVDTLVIKQSLDDWCGEDRSKLRLKDYQGRVAVFQGADPQSDVLLKVTGIVTSSLPPEVQRSVREGTMEFKSQDELNDALENLDEYVTD
ncbi:MAG: hypothetical protein ABFD04_09180 [Syntrophomonas sp.]